MILLFVACSPGGDSGTAVGNPGKLGIVATEVPTDVVLSRVDVAVQRVELCPDEVLAVDAVVDALGSGHVTELPAGTWCGLHVVGDVLVEGSTSGGTAFDVALAPEALGVYGSFEVDGDALLLALPIGAFLDAAELEAFGTDVSVDAVQASELGWAEQLGGATELFGDVDDDGEVDAGETRAVGDSAQSSAGCGCDSGGATRWWSLLPLWWWRRRRS